MLILPSLFVEKLVKPISWAVLMIVITSRVWYKTRPGLAIADPGIITHMYRHGCRGADFNSPICLELPKCRANIGIIIGR